MLQTIHDRTRPASGLHKAHKVKVLVHTFARDANLMKLYRSGAVTRLKPFFRVNKTYKPGSLLRVLRQFVLHERRSKEAKEALVRSNLRFVVSIAKNYRNRGMPLSDLIQEGNIGLIKSIEKFDYRRGYRISTYAGWWIRQSIIRALENKALTIRVPVYMNGKARKMKQLLDDDCLHPEAAAAIESSGYDKVAYRALQAMQEPISLDATVNDSRCLHESIADSQAIFLPDREVASFYCAKEQKEFSNACRLEREALLGCTSDWEMIQRTPWRRSACAMESPVSGCVRSKPLLCAKCGYLQKQGSCNRSLRRWQEIN